MGGDFLKIHSFFKFALCGAAAGVVAGVFGAGGGLVLIPLLSALTPLQEQELFPASIVIILPICLVSLMTTARTAPLPWAQAAPYLVGSAAGGALAGIFGRRIPVLWLHRALGVLILWGGIRYLC